MYKWKIDKDLTSSDKLLEKIRPSTVLDFDVSVVKELKGEEFEQFREEFCKLIYNLRRKKITINYDNLRLQSIKHNVILVGPKFMQIDISNKCNYKCKFCIDHSSFSDFKGTEIDDYFMPFEDIKKIIDQSYEIGAETIYICGNGETLLHPKIIDILSYIGKYDFTTTLFTNASISEVVSKILKLPPSLKLDFIVNLVAADPKKFKEICGLSSSVFKKVSENIKKINKVFPVSLNYLIYEDTYEDIFKYIRLASSLGVRRVQFKFPTLHDSEQRKILLTDKKVTKLLEKVGEIKDFARKLRIEADLRNIIDFCKQASGRVKIGKCYYGWFFSLITPEGDVYNCCVENKPIAKIVAGNLKEAFFSPVYLSRLLEGKQGIKLNSENWKKCASCVRSAINIDIDRGVLCCE